MNLYAYVRNSPLAYVDPSGLTTRLRDWDFSGVSSSIYGSTSIGTQLSSPFSSTNSPLASGMYGSSGGQTSPFSSMFTGTLDTWASASVAHQRSVTAINSLYRGASNVPGSIRNSQAMFGTTLDGTRNMLLGWGVQELLAPYRAAEAQRIQRLVELQRESQMENNRFFRSLDLRITMDAMDLQEQIRTKWATQYVDAYHAVREDRVTNLMHTGVDVLGAVPIVGNIVDAANAGLYAMRGNPGQAALSAAAAIPFIGYGATGAKYAKRALGAADFASDAFRYADRGVDALRLANRSTDVVGLMQRAHRPVGLLTPGLAGVSRLRRGWLNVKHYRTLRQLKQNRHILAPSGTMSIRKLSELGAATGREVGLFRLKSGERIMKLGKRSSIEVPRHIRRIIAHTHTDGNLLYSPDDVVQLWGRSQHSSVLISPSGESLRFPTPIYAYP